MFSKIAVAYNQSPESGRALRKAIHLARVFGSELHAITVLDDPAPYEAFVAAADICLTRTLENDRRESCVALQASARAAALAEGIDLETHMLEGEVCEAIVRFLTDNRADLLVIGLHRQVSHVSRLWSSIFQLALDAPCSVLGVH